MTKDLSITQIENGGITESLIDRRGLGTAASKLPRLANQVMSELFTELGSVRFRPAYGSPLLSEIKYRNVTSIAEVSAILEQCVRDLQTKIRINYYGSDPDEQLKYIEVLNVEQGDDSVTAALRVTNESGERYVTETQIRID